MLKILKQKIKNSHLQQQIQIHKALENTLNFTSKFNFILAFYAFHEMKYIDAITEELPGIVKPETKILFSEQRFQVSKYTFETIIQK